MSIDFDSETTYGDDDDKYIKIKIEIYEDIIATIFIIKKGLKKYQKKNVPHKCLWIIILDSVLDAHEKYPLPPQMFLEECLYAEENIKNKNYIDKELKPEYDSHSDSDINNEE